MTKNYAIVVGVKHCVYMVAPGKGQRDVPDAAELAHDQHAIRVALPYLELGGEPLRVEAESRRAL